MIPASTNNEINFLYYFHCPLTSDNRKWLKKVLVYNLLKVENNKSIMALSQKEKIKFGQLIKIRKVVI